MCRISLLLLVISSPLTLSSLIYLDDPGVYSRVTVKIKEEVPRQYCQRVIEGVKVRIV